MNQNSKPHHTQNKYNKKRESVMVQIEEEAESTRHSMKLPQASTAQLDMVLEKLAEHLRNPQPQDELEPSPDVSERSSDETSSSDESQEEPGTLTLDCGQFELRPPQGFVFSIPRIILNFLFNEEYSYVEELIISKRLMIRNSSIRILFQKKAQGHLIFTINPDINNQEASTLRTRNTTMHSADRSRSTTRGKSIFNSTHTAPSPQAVRSASQSQQTLSNFTFATTTIKTLDEEEDEVIKPRRLKRMLSSIRQDQVSDSDEEKIKEAKAKQEEQKLQEEQKVIAEKPEKIEQEPKEEQFSRPVRMAKVERRMRINSEDTPGIKSTSDFEDMEDEESAKKKKLRKASHPLMATRNHRPLVDQGAQQPFYKIKWHLFVEHLLYKFHNIVDDEESSHVAYEDVDGVVRKHLSEKGKQKLKLMCLAVLGVVGLLLMCFIIAIIQVEMKFDDL